MMPYLSGVMFAKAFATAPANMRVTKMATVSTRSISTRWKVSGRFCALGCVRIVAFLKKSCRSTWDSLSLYTMSDDVVGPYWDHFWIRYCNR